MQPAVFAPALPSSPDSTALEANAQAQALPAPLSAHGLDEQARQAMQDLLREGESLNTRMSYQSALRYWAAWHALRYGGQIALPLAVDCVLQFVVDHAQRSTPQGLVCEMPPAMDQALMDAGYKSRPGAPAHNTLVHRVAVLSKAHQVRDLANPCHDPRVRELLSRTRKAYAKRGALPQKKDALTRELLTRLLDTCDDSLRGRRDRALLLFAWASGGRRRSEVAGADMRFLRRLPSGDYLYTLTHSKTNQAGIDAPENHKPVLGAAAQALGAWLEASGIGEGAIFRRIRKGGHLGEPLTPPAVRNIVRERCEIAGVEGDFSAHSLRSGFVTEAGRRNVSLSDTMAMTGHQSVATVMGYFRAESATGNKAARMMEEL
ncbi:MAG: site-specific integrase [Comamonas sp.]